MAYIDEKNRRIFATYSDAKSKAMDPKDKTKVENFLKSLKADAVEWSDDRNVLRWFKTLWNVFE